MVAQLREHTEKHRAFLRGNFMVFELYRNINEEMKKEGIRCYKQEHWVQVDDKEEKPSNIFKGFGSPSRFPAWGRSQPSALP